MSAKKVFFAALLGMCCSWYTARAQGLYPRPSPPPVAPTEAGSPQAKAETTQEMGTGLSSWITYERHNCCTSQGSSAPILTELFFRIGPTFPVGGGFLGQHLDTGWLIGGGGRALFFNSSWSGAWAVDLGVTNTYNPSRSTTPVLVDRPGPRLVTIRSLDRTFVNLGFGREWYFGMPAISDDAHLRFGADFGGRYGSAKVEFNEVRHRNQVVEGIYMGLHSDLEIPWGRCTYLVGIRGEFSHTWSNILANGRGDLDDISLLANFGFRY